MGHGIGSRYFGQLKSRREGRYNIHRKKGAPDLEQLDEDQLLGPPQSGQSLVEYLILVAVIGVSTIGIATLVQKTLKVQYANSIHALNGEDKRERQVDDRTIKSHVQRQDLSDFMDGAAKTEKSPNGSNNPNGTGSN